MVLYSSDEFEKLLDDLVKAIDTIEKIDKFADRYTEDLGKCPTCNYFARSCGKSKCEYKNFEHRFNFKTIDPEKHYRLETSKRWNNFDTIRDLLECYQELIDELNPKKKKEIQLLKIDHFESQKHPLDNSNIRLDKPKIEKYCIQFEKEYSSMDRDRIYNVISTIESIELSTRLTRLVVEETHYLFKSEFKRISRYNPEEKNEYSTYWCFNSYPFKNDPNKFEVIIVLNGFGDSFHLKLTKR